MEGFSYNIKRKVIEMTIEKDMEIVHLCSETKKMIFGDSLKEIILLGSYARDENMIVRFLLYFKTMKYL